MVLDQRTSFDPYDLWATPIGVAIKKKYYAGYFGAKLVAIGIGIFDWLLPNLSRRMADVKPQSYPIVIAHTILQLKVENRLTEPIADELLQTICSLAVNDKGNPTWAWGLGFPWMSKNGLYGPEIPFVTHTPYVMEALLILAEFSTLQDHATALFQSSGDFLSTLLIMHKSADDLALSYAPIAEPNIVVNANAYAAFAYSLQALYGKPDIRPNAREYAILLSRWVVRQQENNGSWLYFAKQEFGTGNFIDCFHSCFVIKNLLKVKEHIPEAEPVIAAAIEKGWQFIREEFYNPEHGLCKRFTIRDIKDPFVWDIYDQAEYLGLLLDFDLVEEAIIFAENVEKHFRRGPNWYCRIDFLGRPWGKNFLRWGIVQFWYHHSRLTQRINEKGND